MNGKFKNIDEYLAGLNDDKRAALEALGAQEGERILDLGCGDSVPAAVAPSTSPLADSVREK